MDEPTHLDDLLAIAREPVAQQLVAAFQKLLPNPDASAVDFATELKTVMEESVLTEAGDAAP